MKSFKHDPALVDLPAPISLTPDQMSEVAAGCGCVVVVVIHIAGGIPGPVYMASAAPPQLAM
jgi:hypothetical protein